VLAPGALVRVLVATAQDFLRTLHEEGSTESWHDRMLDFAGLNAFLGTDELLESAGG
jgi:2-methylisocitrate lyase-like PEP mutase family enzyme